ncbi:FMN reductase [Streptomyces sp. NPDC003393]
MRTWNLVVVSAGLSDPSSTRLLADRLAGATRSELRRAGYAVDVYVIELRDLAAEISRHLTLGSPGPDLAKALDRVTRADGLIVVTPIFAASYSGLFKSFFDLIDPMALIGTPVLTAATGGTSRHSLALEHALRPLFAYLHATVVPTAVYAATEDWGAVGDSRTEGLPTRITRAARELATLVGARAQDAPPATEHGGDGPSTALDEGVVPFAEQLAALAVRPPFPDRPLRR